MTPERMIEKAKEQQELMRDIRADDAKVGFIIPGQSFTPGRRRRLFKDGPLGEPVGTAKGGIYVLFDAQEVIDACEALIRARDGTDGA